MDFNSLFNDLKKTYVEVKKEEYTLEREKMQHEREKREKRTNFFKSKKFIITVIVSSLILITIGLLSGDDDARIDKLLSENKFEKAREVAISSDYYGKEERLQKVNIAYFNYILENGDLNAVRNLSVDLNATKDFQEFIKVKYPFFIENNKDELFKILMDWTFYEQYKEKVFNEYWREITQNNKEKFYDRLGNQDFNDERQQYNQIIDRILNKAVIEEDITTLKKCLKLYEPEAVIASKKLIEKSRNGEDYSKYDVTFKLENKAKKDAEKYIKENGIVLK